MSRLVANTSHAVKNHYNSNPGIFLTNHINKKTEKGLQINDKITITKIKIFDVKVKHDSQ